MIVAALALLGCLGIFYHAPARSFLRNTVGDAVVVVALYGALRAVWPRGRPVAAAGAVFLLACTVEALQSHVIPSLVDTSRPLVAATLGSTFDWGDLAAYFVGLALCAAADSFWWRPSEQAHAPRLPRDS